MTISKFLSAPRAEQRLETLLLLSSFGGPETHLDNAATTYSR